MNIIVTCDLDGTHKLWTNTEKDKLHFINNVWAPKEGKATICTNLFGLWSSTMHSFDVFVLPVQPEHFTFLTKHSLLLSGSIKCCSGQLTTRLVEM